MAKIAGSAWINGADLHYIDNNGIEKYYTGVDLGATTGIIGSAWVDGNNLFYIDENGRLRRIDATGTSSALNALAGSPWIDSWLRWITNTGGTQALAHTDHQDNTTGTPGTAHSDYGYQNYAGGFYTLQSKHVNSCSYNNPSYFSDSDHWNVDCASIGGCGPCFGDYRIYSDNRSTAYTASFDANCGWIKSHTFTHSRTFGHGDITYPGSDPTWGHCVTHGDQASTPGTPGHTNHSDTPITIGP